MAKIILYNGVAPDGIQHLKKQLGCSDIRFDEKLIAYLESLPVITEIDGETLTNMCRQNPDKIYAIEISYEVQHETVKKRTYVGWSSKYHYHPDFGIVEYDDSHRHMITEYDGSESLIDIDEIEYECVDRAHNLWRKIY